MSGEPVPSGMHNWALEVKHILIECGLPGVWEANQVDDKCQFLKYVLNQLSDLERNLCLQANDASDKFNAYAQFKRQVSYEPYLDNVRNVKYKKYLAKLRLHSLGLKKELSFHRNTLIQQPVCECCDRNEIEDECRFVLKCPLYDDLRESLIPIFYVMNSSEYTFALMMAQTENTELMYRLGKYVYLADGIRKQHLMQTV